jgi:hypothetical protein
MFFLVFTGLIVNKKSKFIMWVAHPWLAQRPYSEGSLTIAVIWL